MTSPAGPGRPRRWTAGLAWGLWALTMLGSAVVPWLDSLLRQAGRPDLAVWVPGSIVGPLLAVLGAATVGAVLASRRPRHPVGWLLLGFALSLTASGVIFSYVTYGLVARPGALPAAATVARYYPATARPAQPGAAVDPDRVAAICPLALVGLCHRGHPRGPGPGGGGGAGTVGPAAAAGQQSLERPRSGRCPAGRHPGRPSCHRRGRGRGRRVAGGALPPRPRGGAPAAALGGVSGDPDAAG